MRATRSGSRGWFVDNGRWEQFVAIILGLLLTVALGRAASAALTLITPDGDPPITAATSSATR